MAAEDLLINDSSNGEAVKAVSEGLPQLYVEPALAWWETQTCIIRTKLQFVSASGLFLYVRQVSLFSLTLIVEAIYAVNGSTLVVSP